MVLLGLGEGTHSTERHLGYSHIESKLEILVLWQHCYLLSSFRQHFTDKNMVTWVNMQQKNTTKQ